MARIALLAVALLLGGCALTTGHVNLAYEAQPDSTKIASAASSPVAVQVSDKRPTHVVGEKINGFGMKTADIVSDNDPAQTLQTAFETELQHRGFTLGTGGDVIAVNLTTLKNQFTVGWFSGESTANMGMDVSVKRADGFVAFNKYVTGQNQDWIELATEGNAEATLNGAMRDGVGKVFSDGDFIAALKKQ